jgi:hypothetical protein
MAGWPASGPVVAASWPAAAEAARLLAAAGADVIVRPQARLALAAGAAQVEAASSTAGRDWADCGAMALTGSRAGPPLLAAGAAATVARGAALAFELLTGVSVDGPALLGERAALTGLTRQGQTSAGGGTRLLRAADGWWALNLARDADLVPALTQTAAGHAADAWATVAGWASIRPVADVIGRAALLGLAAAGLAETAAPATPWQIHRFPAAARERPGSPALVVSLGALWAAPLAAHLLGLSGHRVIHVESESRPDPTRWRAPEFFGLLHRGHEHRTVAFTPGDSELRALLLAADVVIEASRPRALAALGMDAASVLADRQARTWLRITGHRDGRRVAFGDDAAVAGGLVAWQDGGPAFAADAIADPLTGLLGALAVAACARDQESTLIEISMSDVAAYCAASASADDTDPAQPLPAAPPRVASRQVTGLDRSPSVSP